MRLINNILADSSGIYYVAKNKCACLPDNISFIPAMIFKNCITDSKLIFNKRIKHIGAIAFSNCMQIDEVRYLENLEPLGLNFIKLGLQDVLFNPQTKLTISRYILIVCIIFVW